MITNLFLQICLLLPGTRCRVALVSFTSISSITLSSMAAVGCSYLIPPEDAWLRRNEDEMTVGCYSSLQTWILRCVGHEWIGALPGNCSSNSKRNYSPLCSSYRVIFYQYIYIYIYLYIYILYYIYIYKLFHRFIGCFSFLSCTSLQNIKTC